MQTLIERGCGLDVHQATVVACLLIALQNRKVQKQVRTFDTTTRELLKLREWLLAEGCTHVAMESTGVVLEASLRDSGRSLGDCGGQRTTHQEGSGAQDRRKGCGMDCRLALPWVAALQLRSAEAHPRTP